jgi:hypothetical protein
MPKSFSALVRSPSRRYFSPSALARRPSSLFPSIVLLSAGSVVGSCPRRITTIRFSLDHLRMVSKTAFSLDHAPVDRWKTLKKSFSADLFLAFLSSPLLFFLSLCSLSVGLFLLPLALPPRSPSPFSLPSPSPRSHLSTWVCWFPLQIVLVPPPNTAFPTPQATHILLVLRRQLFFPCSETQHNQPNASLPLTIAP